MTQAPGGLQGLADGARALLADEALHFRNHLIDGCLAGEKQTDRADRDEQNRREGENL